MVRAAPDSADPSALQPLVQAQTADTSYSREQIAATIRDSNDTTALAWAVANLEHRPDDCLALTSELLALLHRSEDLPQDVARSRMLEHLADRLIAAHVPVTAEDLLTLEALGYADEAAILALMQPGWSGDQLVPLIDQMRTSHICSLALRTHLLMSGDVEMTSRAIQTS